MHEPTGQGLGDHPVAGVERKDGSVVVHLTGELDLHNAPAMRETLLAVADENPDRLVVDLAAVEFIDSTALGVFVETRTKLVNRRGFMLASPGLETHRALQISGLDQHLSVHESVESALQASVA
jgi:anti-sigma B factor antagonist